MSDYRIIDTDADNIDGCSLCGNKNANNLGFRRKTNWLKDRYGEGLRYKVLRSEKVGVHGYSSLSGLTEAKRGSGRVGGQ